MKLFAYYAQTIHVCNLLCNFAFHLNNFASIPMVWTKIIVSQVSPQVLNVERSIESEQIMKRMSKFPNAFVQIYQNKILHIWRIYHTRSFAIFYLSAVFVFERVVLASIKGDDVGNAIRAREWHQRGLKSNF